ncbi:MAG: glycosyltransferase [Acidimicrobiales bacterium]
MPGVGFGACCPRVSPVESPVPTRRGALLGPTTLFDARWDHHAGATTFTRLLLHGLAEVAPPGRWLLWGPAAMVGPGWPGSTHVPTRADPASWFGQRSALHVPRADRAFHPHQTRPVHRIPAASCILDLIQLQHPSAPLRLAKELRLRASVRAARVLFTITSSVRDELISRFGVEPSSVTVLGMPVDRDVAARVAARRSAAPQERYLLAVGRFDRHKNLPRLVDAFARTRFAATGGALHLVGGTVRELAGLGVGSLPPGVVVRGRLSPAELEDAMVGATALVQASLVEGYGLPVAEALLAELPVASSPVPAATEFGPAGVPVFDPRSEAAITEAIDETVDLVDRGTYWAQVARAPWAASRPTARNLANQVLDGLARIGPAG